MDATELPKQAELRLGQNVRDLRKVKGWSQAQLAVYLRSYGIEMHQSTVAKLELAMRPTAAGEIAALATIFGIGIERLFAEPDRYVPTKRELAILIDQRDALLHLAEGLEESELEAEAKAAAATAQATEARGKLDRLRAERHSLLVQIQAIRDTISRVARDEAESDG